jgi:surface carbohydrate biosynthesis protein
MSSLSAQPCVVLLVDSKVRDLPVAALLAHHLEKRGVRARLEPLEAYQGALAAHRPRMIVFNHLTASHLAAYSRRLHEMGVLTAVLPNEGIFYDADDLVFNSGRYHAQAHIDCFFCWNHVHAQALREHGGQAKTRIEVIGVPRFDFYFAPWSRLYAPPPRQPGERPVILLCTNFATAHYWELPRSEGDKFFAAWKDRIPRYRNYWKSIEAHFKGRQKALKFLQALLEADRWQVVLRPHPREDAAFYSRWLAELPLTQQRQVHLDATSNITSLILGCDVEISCETCTTALESWIAGKPTIELLMERDPLWYYEEPSACNVPCAQPEELPGLVEAALTHGVSPPLMEKRRAHLAKWCHSPDGHAAEKMADIIAATLARTPAPDWSKLNFRDRRRAWKWQVTQAMDQPYHYDPLLALKHQVWPERYRVKYFSQRKGIRPSEAHNMQRQIEACLDGKAASSNSTVNA